MKLGGWMPTHAGLRYLPVNARALDYQCVLFSIASESGQPLLVTEADAYEFVKMTRGVEVFVQVPGYIHPALPEIESRDLHRAYFHRIAKMAAVLKAKALIMDLPLPWANGKAVSMEEIENRMVDFFQDVIEDIPVWFRITPAGLGNPQLLDRVTRRLGGEGFAYVFDPTRWNLSGETVTDLQLEAILESWGGNTVLVQLSRFTEDEVGPARRLGALAPIILTMQSLTEQAAAAEQLRALSEEVDLLSELEK